jgi:transposase-like protein
MPHPRFTKAFRDEAVRLALTSGRSRRAVAADLGVGLATLRHWLDRRRGRETDDPEALGRYIDGFYNPVWRHSTLDYLSPVQFERLAE